ncbi:hypothetical protein [Streptomyces sp. NPDC058672]|uniref:hypothetical protein n=1 Tax=Streptomyces sp. NPDC058672 TaxID=3346591 RepID=UPI0036601FE6
MAKVTREQQLDADVGYHGFAFQESDDADLPVPFPDGFQGDVFLNAFPGRIDLYSAGHTHTASVTVQVWDGPPPAQDAAKWDELGEADYESTSGEVALWSMSLGRSEDLVPLADTGGSWHVRACCTGRSEVARLSEEEGTAHGVERYLIQFWPAS